MSHRILAQDSMGLGGRPVSKSERKVGSRVVILPPVPVLGPEQRK